MAASASAARASRARPSLILPPSSLPRTAESVSTTTCTSPTASLLFGPMGSAPESACVSASILLAYCDMKTLYLRNVPDDVVERLQRLAARDGTSVGAVAVRELAEASRRADNPALLGTLPDLEVDAGAIVEALSGGRSER